MNAEEYARVREIFHQVCQLSPSEIQSKLEELSGNEPHIRVEIQRLIDALDESETMASGVSPIDMMRHGMPEITGYRILNVLGEGGMGTVYEAEQIDPPRKVSLKLIRIGYQSEAMKHRFKREAQVLARLKHPGIAQIYSTGFCDEQIQRHPYISMELVEGMPMLKHADSFNLNTQDRLKLAYKVCEAVDHAHKQGVIHRDLKPSNILVDENGQPKVLDFGIARITDSDIHSITQQTEVGQILGTTAYMSPEQASGDPSIIDARTDVYSLGVLMFELLSNKRPHNIDSLSISDAIRVIREEDPTLIGHLNTRFRGDIETIIAKALERDPSRRYQSAKLLADDINRYLRNEPINARKPTASYKFKKLASRNKGLVIGASMVFMALLIGLIGMSIAFTRESAARQRSVEALARSQGATNFLENLLVGLNAGQTQGKDTALLSEMLSNAYQTVDEIEYPIVRAEMLQVIGRSYFMLYEFKQAEEILRNASHSYQEFDPGNTSEIVAINQLLASSVNSQGNRDQAIEILQDSINRLDSDDIPHQRVEALTLLAEYTMDSGAWNEALGIVESAKAINQQEALADNTGLHMLHGMILRRLARFEESEKLYILALGKFEEEKNDLQIARSYNALALVADSMGNLELAEERYRKSLALREQVDSRPNPSTAVISYNLGKLLVQQGKFEEAVPFLSKSIDMHNMLYGENFFGTGFPIAALALVKSELEDFDEALNLIDSSLDRFVSHFGEVHPRTMRATSEKGQILSQAGMLVESQAHLERALDMAHTLDLDPAIYDTPIRIHLSQTLAQQGLISEAIECLRNGLKLYENDNEVTKKLELLIEELVD